MSVLHTALMAIVQGFTELLPVSSSAHVILIGKFLGFDPGSPEGVLTLLFLHTGTMGAVLVHYRKHWLSSVQKMGLLQFLKLIFLATATTGVIGLTLKLLIENLWLRGSDNPEVEHLFRNTPLMATALASAGILILISAKFSKTERAPLDYRSASFIGAIQGLCLPFRGFSRSGATISVAMLSGLSRTTSEAFSFALAVVITPPLIVREILRLQHSGTTSIGDTQVVMAATVGLSVSFLAGLFALRWLSSWVERGRWQYFGFYCLAFSSLIFILHYSGQIP